jgi:uncharacterized membrane protein
MYLFDPDHGRRRRALIRDQAVRAQSNVKDLVEAGTRDLQNRGTAFAGRTWSWVRRRMPADDAVLAERVRSKMGRHAAHPGEIEVSASGGKVTLRGSILAHEHGDLVDAVRAVAGVKSVVDELSVFETAQDISELSGEGRKAGQRAELSQENWAPGPRLLAGAGAVTLALYALRRRGLMRLLTLGAGAALILRTATNKPLSTLAGRDGYKGIDIDKTIHINAAVEQVFQFLADYENFPLFMRNVRSVQVHADGRSHWIVAGPLGATVEWDAITTRIDPNACIEWSSIEGSAVEHAGEIRVDPSDDGTTRLHVRMSYNPPAGTLGHAVAKLFGADPKSEMDEDLMRLKNTIETGKAPRDAAAQWQSQSIGAPV